MVPVPWKRRVCPECGRSYRGLDAVDDRGGQGGERRCEEESGNRSGGVASDPEFAGGAVEGEVDDGGEGVVE